MGDDFNQRFDRAKRMSDFVGMWTRIAFLLILNSFLLYGLVYKKITYSDFENYFIYIGITSISILIFVMFALTLKVMTGYIYNISNIYKLPSFATWSIAVAGGLVILAAMIGISFGLISYSRNIASRMLDVNHVQSQ